MPRTGALLYVAHPQGISGYAIDRERGTLVPLPGSPFGLVTVTEKDDDDDERSLGVDPLGRFLYLSGHSVHPLAIGPSGAVTSLPLLGDFDASEALATLVLDPQGRFVYVLAPSPRPPRVHAFRIDAGKRAFTPVAGSPFPLPNSRAAFLSIDPSGRFAYYAHRRFDPELDPCEGPGRTYGYALDSQSGALLGPTAGSPVSNGTVPSGMVFLQGGSRAYVFNSGDNVQLYGPCPPGSITGYDVDGTTGTLAELAGSPFMEHRDGNVYAVAPSGDEIYGAWSGRLTRFRVDASTGRLIPGASLPRPVGARALMLDAVHHRLFVLPFTSRGFKGESKLGVYRVDEEGGLEELEQVPLGPGRMEARLAPHGGFVYVLDRERAQVLGFAVDSSQDLLRPVDGSPFATGVAPFALALVE